MAGVVAGLWGRRAFATGPLLRRGGGGSGGTMGFVGYNLGVERATGQRLAVAPIRTQSAARGEDAVWY